MHRRWVATSPVAILAFVLSACTSIPGTVPNPADTGASVPPAPTPTAGAVHLPTCGAVTTALSGLQGTLAFNQQASVNQTTPESYPQVVCIYTTPDTVTQLGVTIAAIPLRQSEIDGYAGLPNAIADARLIQHRAILQTLAAGDGSDGHLHSALYLFDAAVSITIQALSVGGAPTSVTLPQLTVPAAADAAFAIRALVT